MKSDSYAAKAFEPRRFQRKMILGRDKGPALSALNQCAVCKSQVALLSQSHYRGAGELRPAREETGGVWGGVSHCKSRQLVWWNPAPTLGTR
jgi:hypothetical protein